MNGIELFNKSGKPTGVFYCAECRKCYGNQKSADECCSCSICGELVHRDSIGKCDYTSMHGECLNHRRRERLTARLLSAIEVFEDGWVYLDGVGPRDGFFQSSEELVEWLDENRDDDDEEPPQYPEFIFACKRLPFRGITADRIVEMLSDDLDEKCELSGIHELQEACDRFNEANKGLVHWDVDYTKKIRLIAAADESVNPNVEV